MAFLGLHWGARRTEQPHHRSAEQQLEDLLVKLSEAIALIDSGRIAGGVDQIKALRREHVMLVRQRRKHAKVPPQKQG